MGMKVRLGHVVHTFGPRPLADVLGEIAAIGYRGVELFTSQAAGFSDRPAELGRLLGEHGLVLSSLYYPADLVHAEQAGATVAVAAEAASFLRALGAHHLIVGEGTGPASGEVDYVQAARTVERIGAACAAQGVQACFHPHMGSVVENRAQIERIFALTDPNLVHFCIDTGHLAKGGSDPAELARTYLDRLKFVHLKDMRPSGEFVELGRGSLDNDAILALLRQAGYRGWILPEVPISAATLGTPAASAAVSFGYLEQALGTSIDA